LSTLNEKFWFSSVVDDHIPNEYFKGARLYTDFVTIRSKHWELGAL
jgi:hypothetical protein